MADIPPILVQLQADVTQLKAGLAQAESSLKNLDDNVQKSGGAFDGFTAKLKQVGATLGVTFAATQVVSFFKESINAAMEAESAQTRLREILLNTKGATEAQIAALGAQADALSKVGIASKENITVTQSQLATFDLQGKTINKLTPAILDYVAAEKGATASSDDYKQMTNGLAQALQGNFGALTRVGFVLDEDTKKKISNGTESERAAAITEVLNSTYKDFNKTLAETPEGRMIKLKQEFGDLQQEIGEALLPAMETFANILRNVVIPAIRQLINFVKNNKDEIKAFAITLGIGATAWGIYTVAVNRAKIAQKALNLVQKANPIGIIITAVALLVAGIVKLWKSSETFRNIVITMAKAALNAFASIIPMVARVYEVIAKVVTGPMRLLLTAISKLPGVGKYAKQGLDLINKGLDGISDLGDKASKKAKELAASLDNVGKQGKKAAEETEKAGKKAKDVWAGSKDPGGGMSKEDKKRLDKVKDLEKKATEILKDMAEVRLEAQEKIAEAEKARDEKIFEAKERYAERVVDLNERYQERVADANEKYGEALAEAENRRDEKIAEAKERANERFAENYDRYIEKQNNLVEKYNETVINLENKRNETIAQAQAKFNNAQLEIQAEYDKKRISLTKQYENKVRELQEGAEKKRQEIVQAGQAKLVAIVEKSRQRLRDAFAKGTEFKLEDLFGIAKEKGGTIVDAIKNQLAQTKNLQTGAGELAGQGFSQTFIEQIVQAGPTAGLAMIEEIKKLSPEQQSQVQSMYAELDKINQTGMDSLANTLSTSTQFATSELEMMYQETQADITNALAEINSDLSSNVAEAKAVYEIALAEAATIRDEKLAEATNALNEALAEAKKNFDAAISEARTTLNKALLDAKKELDDNIVAIEKELQKSIAAAHATYNKSLEDAKKALDKAIKDADKDLKKGLEDAQKDLNKAIEDAMKAFDKAVDEINASTQKKLNDLMAKLRETAAAMAALQSSAGGGYVAAGSAIATPIVTSPSPTVPKPVVTPIVTSPSPTVIPKSITEIPRAVPVDGSIASFRAGEERSMAALNITQNFTSVDATAWDVHEKTLSAIRYGQAVTPKPTPKVAAPTTTGGGGGKYGMLIE